MRLILLCLLGLSVVAAFSCKDQNNNDVDWWFAYKMPKVSGDNSIAGLSDGHAFYYLDANNPSFTASSNDLTSEQQAVAYTMAQYYQAKGDSSVFHVLYNDEEAPEQLGLFEKIANLTDFASYEYGHTKGVAFFDKTDGVWYVHSVPKFPSAESYGYPESGRTYGQSMLCISLNYDQLKKVGTQLYFNHPDIYSSQLPTAMAQENPDLAKVIGGSYQRGTTTTSVLDLTTKGGQTFRSFAKSGQFGKDLYDSLVAPDLKTPLNVETWRRGSRIPLDCQADYLVLDAQEMKVGTVPEFKYTKDHSKLAVSASSSSPYVCIGDINRMHSQFVRGGGTVCLLNKDVWNAYSPLVETTNNCN